jgi:CheY-like chemotaxis protein
MPVDLLVTDIGLPGGLDGRQMADAGRQRRPGLPVLFMTGYTQSPIMDKHALQPSTAVLTKPFALDALISSVNALLGNDPDRAGAL